MSARKYIPLPSPVPKRIQHYLDHGYCYDGLHLSKMDSDKTIIILMAIRSLTTRRLQNWSANADI